MTAPAILPGVSACLTPASVELAETPGTCATGATCIPMLRSRPSSGPPTAVPTSVAACDIPPPSAPMARNGTLEASTRGLTRYFPTSVLSFSAATFSATSGL